MTRRLGLTFDLRADHLVRGATAEDASEFEEEETVAALEAAASDLGWEVSREPVPGARGTGSWAARTAGSYPHRPPGRRFSVTGRSGSRRNATRSLEDIDLTD
jgi:hypothetical protein